MEHAHLTLVHGGIVLTVDRANETHLVSIIETHGEDIGTVAAERLALWGTDIDCSEADPYWCAAVLFLYPLLGAYLWCEG